MKFTEFDLHPDLQKGIDEAQYVECTPVQEQTISRVILGKDVTVQSQTGTGKTAAFLIPLFHLMMTSKPDSKALVIAPTRELAVQIYEEARLLGKYLPIVAAAFYGGVGYGDQEAALKANPQIIIGTPGRLIDFDRSKKLSFHDMGMLVLDEADRLFDMGFYPDIQSIIRKMKTRGERQTLLFSATMSTRVMNIAWEHMSSPESVEIEPEHVTVESIEQTLYHLGRDEKLSALIGLFRKRNPKNAIVFTNMKRTAEEIAKRLEINGFGCEYIMGDLPQSKRLKIITRLKSGDLKFLVATDVAARGLHINDLEMVVNYDLPEDPESYVHRIGRTARAGKSGVAISFSDERYVYGLPAIEALIGFKIPIGEVSEDILADDKSKGMRVLSASSRDRSAAPRHGASSNRRSPAGSRSSASSRGNSTRSGGSSRGGRNTPPAGNDLRPRQPGSSAQRGKTAAPATHGGETNRSRDSARPRKGMTREERIEYYRQKYGENFDESKIGGKSASSNRQGMDGSKPSQRSSGRGSGSGSAASKQNRTDKNKRRARQEKGQAASTKNAAEMSSQPQKGGLAGFLSRIFSKNKK